MMDLVFDHRPQPFACRDRRSCRRHAFLIEIVLRKTLKNLHRFGVQSLNVRQYILVAIRELFPMPRILAWSLLNILRVHVTLDRSNMPNEITQSEFPILVCPFDEFRRDAIHNPQGSLADLFKIFEELILHAFYQTTKTQGAKERRSIRIPVYSLFPEKAKVGGLRVFL
jgi:hypothetical protein